MTTTLTDLFTSYLDITSPPDVALLSTLANYASTFNERMALKYLAKVSQLPFSLFHVTLFTCYDPSDLTISIFDVNLLKKSLSKIYRFEKSIIAATT